MDRIAPRLRVEAGQEAIHEEAHDGAGEDEVAVAPAAAARGHREVVGAEDEVGGAEGARDAVPVAEAEQREDGEVGAGGLAADREPAGGVERGGAAVHEPAGRVLAVVGAGREGVLGRETVIDADGDEARGLDQRPEGSVLHVGGAERPPAAVDVEVDALRVALGGDDAEAEVAGAAGDGPIARLGEVHRRREDAAALAADAARDLGRDGVHGGLGGEEALDLGVEGARLFERGGIEGLGERRGRGHGRHRRLRWHDGRRACRPARAGLLSRAPRQRPPCDIASIMRTRNPTARPTPKPCTTPRRVSGLALRVNTSAMQPPKNPSAKPFQYEP